MSSKARIKLTGRDVQKLDELCKQIKDIAEKFGVSVKGPVPMPTKRLRIPVLKTPNGSGTGHGNATWDHWEMRIHKRLLDVGADQRTLRYIMKIEIPEDVNIQIQLIE
ncbi:MAG: 30S ribosomal protein S10 [Candidatus Aenigmatarchaeota archaeon]|nr:MAG: 30S ribosomal protein S10 [Candidatus Aenigmarchaeota archaeon]